jgi:hypothetical protein
VALNLSATDFKQYIDKNIDSDKYENASAVNIFTEVVMEVEEDLSYTYHCKYIKKILTYKGKKRYSDVKLGYNKNTEVIELGDCYTLTADGKRVEIPEEAFHDSEYFLTLFSPDYINQWEKVINYPEIVPGNYIVLEYTRKNTDKRFVSGIEYLMEENPYIEKRFTIKYPESVKMRVKALRELENLSIEKTKKNGIVTETFTINNAKLIPQEFNSPAYIYTSCPIVYSNEDNWKEVGDKIFAEFKSGITKSKIVSDKAAEITKHCKNDEEKIRAIYKFLSEDFISKYSIFKEIDFKPLSVEDTYNKRYGSDRDLVALFIAMANAVDIDDCYPALVLRTSTRFDNFQKEYVLPSHIEAVKVYWDGKLLNLGEVSNAFGYSGINNCNLLIGKKKTKFSAYTYDDNLKLTKVNCRTTEDDEYILDYKTEFSGLFDKEYRANFRNETKEKTKIWFDNKQTDKSSILLSGPEFKNLNDLNQNLSLEYSKKTLGFVNNQSKYTYLSLPLEKIDLRVSAIDRSLPFYIYQPISIEEEFVIEDIPEDLDFMIKNSGLDTSLKIGKEKVKCRIEIERDDDNIIYHRKIYIPEGIVPLDKYKEFREIVNNLNNPTNKVIFMEKS